MFDAPVITVPLYNFISIIFNLLKTQSILLLCCMIIYQPNAIILQCPPNYPYHYTLLLYTLNHIPNVYISVMQTNVCVCVCVCERERERCRQEKVHQINNTPIIIIKNINQPYI